MVKLVLTPKEIKTSGLAVYHFKKALRYYVLRYLSKNKAKIDEIDKYLREQLKCPASSRQILLLVLKNLYYENWTLSLKRDLKIGDLKLKDLVQLLECGNLDLVGLHILQKATDYANKQI